MQIVEIGLDFGEILWRMKFNMSCGVVPSRHIEFASSRRTLRARLSSLRSVVPSRHVVQNINYASVSPIANITLSPFHSLRRAWFILSAWKALRSKATVTGHAVSGSTRTERCAWKALRRRTGSLYIATGVLPYISCGVVPSRHIEFASSRRTLRARLPSLRSVVPSRHVVQKINYASVSSIANKRYRHFTLCAERDFSVCNFYASRFSEILKV